MTSSSILIIDDHSIFRSGLKMLLAANIPDIEVYETNSIHKALIDISVKVDLILLDIQLNGLNGIEGIALIKRHWPSVPILMLSANDKLETINESMSRGADGFISKSESAENFVKSVVLGLENNLPKSLIDANLHGQHLTPRQIEVLELLHQGCPNKLIAKHLSLSNNTVRRHVQAILEYFGVSSRAGAVFEARRRGIVN